MFIRSVLDLNCSGMTSPSYERPTKLMVVEFFLTTIVPQLVLGHYTTKHIYVSVLKHVYAFTIFIKLKYWEYSYAFAEKIAYSDTQRRASLAILILLPLRLLWAYKFVVSHIIFKKYTFSHYYIMCIQMSLVCLSSLVFLYVF